MRDPAHLNEVWHGYAGDRCVARQRHHRIAVASQHEGGHILDGYVEFTRQEIAEAGAVEHARHADNLVLRQTRHALKRPDHGVERVGDADHKGVRRIFLDPCADLLHDLQVDFEEVVAAHARLPRNARGDDDDIRALDVRIVVHALESGIEAIDRRDSARSKALPWGKPSMMSKSTTSPSSLRPIR